MPDRRDGPERHPQWAVGMSVRPVTRLVEAHGLVIIDSDAHGYDRWRDDLAVPDPYETEWIPMYSHGLVLPEEPQSRKEDQ